MRRALATFVLIALVAAPSAASARCPRTSVLGVENEVMCPVCGTPLAEATDAPQAQAERRYIAALAARCRSKDEIKDALAAQFGDRVLALPRGRGFGIAAYLVPGGAIALAALAVWQLLKRWRRRSDAGAGDEPPLPVADSARVDAELARWVR